MIKMDEVLPVTVIIGCVLFILTTGWVLKKLDE